MRKAILGSVSALSLLALAGVAGAQQNATDPSQPLQVPPPPTTQATQATPAPVNPNDLASQASTATAQQGAQPMPDAAAGAVGGLSTPDATAATGTTTATPSAGDTATAANPPAAAAMPDTNIPTAGSTGGSDQFRSYSAMDKGSFQGSINGGFTAEQLIGKDIVGPDGKNIAEVADLVIEPDNTIKRVIVDVGGFLGIGARPVALDIDQLQKPDGQGGQFRTTMTKEQLKALPRYEKNKQGFYAPGKDDQG